MQITRFFALTFACSISLSCTLTFAQSRQAPAGMFKNLDDEIVGNAIIIRGNQLFIDDFIIEELRGATKVLNRPNKHPRNPLLVRDKPWEPSGPGYGSVVFDDKERLFKMWYETPIENVEPSESLLMYATSSNGLDWTKPLIDARRRTNQTVSPALRGFQASGIFLDRHETDQARKYKMLFSCTPDGTTKSWTTSAAYSADGLNWKTLGVPSLIPFSDTQNCPFWDRRRERYVAFLRFGPPNTRIISRTESEDFEHWSPKVTVLRSTKMDGPMLTQFYEMTPIVYGDVYLGLICAYHNESLLSPTPEQLWTDRKNLHLAYSRNGVTWFRVGAQGAIPPRELEKDADWRRIAEEAVFIPYGEKDKDWDWGTLHPYYTFEPIIVGDEIWFYYFGQNGRNWWTYTGNPPKLDPQAQKPTKGVGLATLRLDGFVSINADKEATLTTRPFVFLGDTLVVNANASGGQLIVEALDLEGKPIDGFKIADCTPITSDSVRHVVQWKGSPDCQLLQARPIKLRFHLKGTKLYSFAFHVRQNHYLQSYD